MKNNYFLILLCCFNILIFTEPAAGFIPNSISTTHFFTNSTTGLFVPAKIFAFDVTQQDGKDLLKWDVSVNPDLVQFQIESSTDNVNFFTVDSVYPKVISGDVASYQFYSPFYITGTRYYRVKLIYDNGYSEYTSIATLNDATTNRVVVLNDGSKQFRLMTPYLLNSINVLNSSGQILIRYNNVPAGSQTINLSDFAPGIYLIQCISNKNEIIRVMNS